MAEKCNISTSFLGHIERGTRKLLLETAVKISECLHISLDALILDGKSVDLDIFPAVEAIVQKQGKAKREQFLKLVKMLAENIDKL
jgi:transcriptional regulator with XRE-family HTH domain